jgi:pimeloyl-ACP methyl ester carboxylesterase
MARPVEVGLAARKLAGMASVEVNGVGIHYEIEGEGEALVLVHGSWTDATGWRFVLPGLAESFRVLSYDRRGHSRSERPDTQGSVHEDADDLAALIEALGFTPAHVVANSYGGNIALRLAGRRPELFRSLSCHEPPLWSLLADDSEGQALLQRGAATIEAIGGRIAEGDHAGAARQFVEEIAVGPGAWEQIPPEVRQVMENNAPTFLDELHDPDQVGVDAEALAGLDVPVRVTAGSDTSPVFTRTADLLAELIPGSVRETIPGAGHVPQLEAPERFVELIRRWIR